MPREVIMPALGMAQNTGLIVAWLKKPGEAVKTGDALMEVETDKAVMEVEAQADGFLTDIRVAAGEAVPVGDVVALISDSPAGSGAAPAPRPADAARARSDAPVPAAPAAPTPIPWRKARRETGRRTGAGDDRRAHPRLAQGAASGGGTGARPVAAGRGRRPATLSRAAISRRCGLCPRRPPFRRRRRTSASRRLTARVGAEAFAGFCAWMRAETGAPPTQCRSWRAWPPRRCGRARRTGR